LKKLVLIQNTMFFFNGRIRNPHIIPVVTRPQPTYTNKVGQSIIIAGCLSIILGLLLILIGFISETDKSTYFGVGSISFTIGFFLSTFTCFYTTLDRCYQNWIYRTHITPSTVETSLLTTSHDIHLLQTPRLSATGKA